MILKEGLDAGVIEILDESTSAQRTMARKVISGEDRRKMSQNTAEAMIDKHNAGKKLAYLKATGASPDELVAARRAGAAAKGRITNERENDAIEAAATLKRTE